jgi:uncharacterized protein YndB with AHSA1/START domain
MRTAPANSVRLSQTIRAAPERLFRAWTDPEVLMHWWRMEAEGWAFAGAHIDLRVGGRFRLGMSSPEGKTHLAVGVYQEVQPFTRLAFTWDWDDPADRVGDTLVTIEFIDAGDNTTEVVLTHERFADAARMSGHDRGWTQLLRLLGRLMEEKPI